MRALGRVSLAVAGLLIIVALVASISVTTATEVVPASGGTYIEGLVGRPGSLNPLSAPANPCDSDIAALVFSGLTKRDENGHLIPDLAERWEASADARIYTFLLRKGALWHDGAPVTADDVVYTVAATQSDEFPVPPWIKAFWQGVIAEKVSDEIARLTLPSAYAPFLQYTTLGLLPAHVLAAHSDDARESYNAQPIGTGPYRVRERTQQHTVLDAAADYPGRTPMIPRLEFRHFRDQPSALQALKNGEVMAVADILPEQATDLERQAGLTVYWAPRASQTEVLFNLSLPFFEDADVRRAFSLALDRQSLVGTTLHGKAVVSNGPFLSTSWANTERAVSPSYDRAAAQLLLDKAGWTDSNNDGVRERQGVKLEFGLLTNDDPLRVLVAQEVARAWTEVGAAVEAQVINSYALVQDYLQPRRFEAVLFGWTNIPDDPDPYEMWHSSQRAGAGLNFSGFASQRADEIIEQARRTGDQDTRRDLYTRFQDMYAELVPALPLYEPMFGFATSSAVHAVRLSFIAEPGDRFRHLSEWYTMTRKVTVTEKQRVR